MTTTAAFFSCTISNGMGLSASSTGAILTVSDPILLSGPQNVTTNLAGEPASRS